MNWYKTSSLELAFTSNFIELLNRAAIESARNMGKVLKPYRLTTIGEALQPRLHKSFPGGVLDIEIWVASRINGEYFNGFATGTKDGHTILVMHPEQARSDYISGIAHEIFHIMERLEGKVVSETGVNPKDHGAYRKLPSERRAREFEERFTSSLEEEV